MTKKKRTVITEESHEIWIIRERNGEASERTQSEDNPGAIGIVSIPPQTQSFDVFPISNAGPNDSTVVTEGADSTGSDYEITED